MERTWQVEAGREMTIFSPSQWGPILQSAGRCGRAGWDYV